MRVRRYTGLAPNAKYDRPLIVIVPKWDVWAPLMDVPMDHEPVGRGVINGSEIGGVSVAKVEAPPAHA